MIITTTQMCVKKSRILVMHLVRHTELVKKYLTFDTRKSKTNMAKKNILEEQVHSDFDRNFGSSPPEVY